MSVVSMEFEINFTELMFIVAVLSCFVSDLWMLEFVHKKKNLVDCRYR